MKKTIILMGIAAMAFASCAKDTVKEVNNGHAIDFRVATQTRASETTTANLTTFYVTAIDESGSNYFTDAAFTKVDTYFSSSPVYYWPGDGSLNFYAYAPSATTLGATVTVNKTTQVIAGYAPAAAIADQLDLVTTTATGSKANEATGVALAFDHQLSQLEVKARNANEAYTYKIKGVRFAQPVAQGDLNLASAEWTLKTDNKAVYSVTYDRVVVLNAYAQNLMETEGDNAMLLPQQLVAWNPETDETNANKGAYISVYAQITTAEGARVYPKAEGMEYAWLAVPVDTKWEAGYKYVYTLDFTDGAGYPDPIGGDTSEGTVLGGPIKFTMEVNPWSEKATMEATTNMLVGTWNLARIENTRYDGAGAEGILEIYDTVEEARDWHGEMWWTFKVNNDTEYVLFPGDPTREEVCNYELIDNHLYIDKLYDQTTGTYVSDMFIRDITEDLVTFFEIYRFSEDSYRETVFYYARIN